MPDSNSTAENSPLETDRLLLLPVQLEDAHRIYRCIQSPQFPHRLPLKELESIQQVKVWLNNLKNLRIQGLVYSWVMESKHSGELLGQQTLSRMEEKNTWALAFWTNPEYWGNGYATEGAKRAIQFAFSVLGAEKIWAGVGKWNQASCRVLEKLGMVYCRDNDHGYESWGEPVATREYELTPIGIR